MKAQIFWFKFNSITCAIVKAEEAELLKKLIPDYFEFEEFEDSNFANRWRKLNLMCGRN